MKERYRFEIWLTILVFILTMIGSTISGFLVYKLTNDERPLLTFTVSDYNKTSGLLNLKVNNFRDTPANNIYVYYQVNNSNNFSEKKEIWHLDELYKGSSEKQIKFSKFQSDLVFDIEDYLDDMDVGIPNNYSLIVNDENPLYVEDYSLLFSLSCDNCKSQEIIINPYELNFDFELNCTKIRYFNCNITKEHVHLDKK